MINQIAPERVDRIMDIEEQLQFSLYKNKSLLDFMLPGKDPGELDPFWVAQALSEEYTANIFTMHWIQPTGAYSLECAGVI